MKRREFLVVGGATLTVLAGCFGGPSRSLPEIPTGQWRQHAQNSQNTSATNVSVPARANPAWDEGEAHMAAPLVDDGTVFSVAGEATALSADSGDQQWETDLSSSPDHTPALTDEHLIVAGDEEIVGLTRADGTEDWSHTLSRIATGAVTVTKEPPNAVVPVGDDRLVAVDHRTGEKQWERPIVAARTPAIADGTVYVTGYRDESDTGVLRALSATDGSDDWDTELDTPDTDPIFVDGEILVGDAGTLAVHDPADGTRLRTLGTFGEQIEATPAVADGTAYVASGESSGELLAVSVTDGTIEWRVEVQVTAGTGISVGEDAVVAPVTDLPGVAAFERGDGTRRWEHTIEGFDAAASTPAVLADGAVFYASNESLGVVALGDLPPQDDG